LLNINYRQIKSTQPLPPLAIKCHLFKSIYRERYCETSDDTPGVPGL